MSYYLLRSGESIIFDTKDIPELPENDNYHIREHPLYKKYRSAQRARYVKACYKATKEAEDSSDFISRITHAQMLLRDPSAWNEYLSCRGITPKPLVGRPKLPDHLKKQNPRIKRSDKMKTLLAQKDITVSPEGKLLLNGKPYEGWIFQQNGRIKFMGDEKFNVEPYTLSTHQFISDYC